VVVGALNEVILRWWKALECSWKRRGVCTCSCSDA